MSKKSREDRTFDDGLVTREQGKAYGEALLQMGAPRSKTPRRVARIMVWGFSILMPVSLLLGFMLADANRSLNVQLSKTVEDQYNPSFKVRYETLGTEVISAWYNKQKSPINLDASIQWAEPRTGSLAGNEATTTTDATPTTSQLKLTGLVFLKGTSTEVVGNAGRFEERLEYYGLINGVPQIIGITIAVPVLSDINSAPVLISPPTILGKPSVSSIKDDAATTPVEDYGAATLPSAAVDVLNRWAAAWTKDSPSELKAAVKDSSTESTYRGLGGGWTYVPNSVSVQWSALAPSGGGAAVARVKWKMQTPATKIPATTGANAKPEQTIAGAVQEQSMDVLVGDYAAGSPAVLAWGQAGTYAELKPYQNAITDKDDPRANAPVTKEQGTEETTTPEIITDAPAAETDN